MVGFHVLVLPLLLVVGGILDAWFPFFFCPGYGGCFKRYCFFFSGLVQVFILVGQSFTFFVVVLGYLPSVLFVFASTCITVSIFFLLIDR